MRLLTFLVVILGLGLPAAAETSRGTMAEAKEMAQAAATHIETVGPEQAFADFGNPDNKRWHDRDLYVIVVNTQSVVQVHGVRPSLNGRTTRSMRDVDGKPFVEEILAIEEHGWVRYKWTNPLTNAVEPKASYVIHTGDYWAVVGAYDQ